jgi:hypothetical protein
MKKLFLFTLISALTFSLNSCSGDDDSAAAVNTQPGGTLTMKIDGNLKTYNTVIVNVDDQTDGETLLTVTASQDGGSNETVRFNVYKGDVGSDVMFPISFVIGGAQHSLYDFNQNVTVNSNNHLKGTFSGNITEWNNETQQVETQHVITEGSYDVTY